MELLLFFFFTYNQGLITHIRIDINAVSKLNVFLFISKPKGMFIEKDEGHFFSR